MRNSLFILATLTLAGCSNADATSGGKSTASRSFPLANFESVVFKGSDDASLSGSSKSLNISLAGSGDINTKQLRTSLLDISLAGSGDIAAHADTSANISLIGSGD
ncbi:MAG: hypothetical protein RLZZ366_487, partial [Pseudomonadota bacterium]